MADQAITSLPKKTASGIASTDYLLGIDSAEGYQMLIQDLGNYIITHATASLAGSTQTLKAAIDALNSNLTYKSGDSVAIQTSFIGKAVSAKDGFYGSIILPKPVSNDSMSATLSSISQYGVYYSDTASHTLNLNSITDISFRNNTMWFKIPSTGITDANTFIWVRFQATITFTS